MLLAVAVLVVLTVAWIDGGAQPRRWIEQPVSLPGQGAPGQSGPGQSGPGQGG
jgi:hypothetical protein